MRQVKKSIRIKTLPKQGHKLERLNIEKEAAEFFVRDEEESIRERTAYRAASERVLSRR